jgi:hypothetical protein
VQGKVTPPCQINPALPPGLEATILKAMALAPADRYQSMDELERALERLIESEGA